MLCIRSNPRRPPSAVRTVYAPMNPPVPRSSAGVCAATKYLRSPWDPTRLGSAPARASAAVADPVASSSWAIDRSRASATGPTIQEVGSDRTPARAVSSLARASLIAGWSASNWSTGRVPLDGASSAIPSGKPLDPVRQVRSGRGGEPARLREHDDRVEGAAGEGDRPRKAQDQAPRVAARLVERILRSAERGGRCRELPRQQQVSGILELVSARGQAGSRSEGQDHGEHAQDRQDPEGDQDTPAPPPVFWQAPGAWVPSVRGSPTRRDAMREGSGEGFPALRTVLASVSRHDRSAGDDEIHRERSMQKKLVTVSMSALAVALLVGLVAAPASAQQYPPRSRPARSATPRSARVTRSPSAASIGSRGPRSPSPCGLRGSTSARQRWAKTASSAPS